MTEPVSTRFMRLGLERAFREAQGEKLIEMALARGLVTAEQVAEAGALIEGLVARGHLRAEDVATLEEALGAEDSARPSADQPPLAPEVGAAASDPARQLAEFVLVDRLGRGGGGEVWKAWDRRIGRWVAIKLPAGALESRAGQERFKREGMAVGRLSHPNIVPVYHVGEDDGRPYLVMPFIDGRTLDQESLPPERIAEIMLVVAEAVEHAHQQGLVHRDLKPGNLMLDRQGRVFILDFGVAHLREQMGGEMTAPGDVLGTAAYMSPEQAQGHATSRDPGTDVYGLGATLYRLVTGVAPFRADSFAAVVAQVVGAEPIPPRKLRPEVKPALEAVILKAMEKDPRRRYATAAELGSDLRRVLAGEATRAPSRGWGIRAATAIVRKRPVAAVLMGLAIVVGVAGWSHVRQTRDRTAALATVREMSQMALDTALRLRRTGDVAQLKQVLPALMSAFEHAYRQAPEVAEVDYSLGRLHRALLNDAKALEFQQRALGKNRRFAPALYERAILLSQRYGNQLGVFTGKIAAREFAATEARKSPELAELEHAIVRDLSDLRSLDLDDRASLAAAGILAYHQRRYDAAIATLRKAVALDPLREEAWSTLAHAAEDAGNLDEADRAYTEGLARDRGYLPHLLGRCWLRLGRNQFDQSEEDSALAMKMEPDVLDAWRCGYEARFLRASHGLDRGTSPLPAYAAAEGELDERLRLDPRNPVLIRLGASLFRYRASYNLDHDLDLGSDLARAYQGFTQLIDPRDPDPSMLAARGRTSTQRATALIRSGQDPSQDFRASEDDLQRAVGLSRNPLYRRFRATLSTERGAYLLAHGQDVASDAARAEEDLSLVLEHPHGKYVAYVLRGRLRAWQGRALLMKKKDPLPMWRSADEDFTRAVEEVPDIAFLWLERGLFRRERAAYLRRAGLTWRTESVAAEADLGRALAIDRGLEWRTRRIATQ